MKLNTLCIVSCGKLKVWDKYPDTGLVNAKEMYIGTFSKKCIEYSEKLYPDSWVILSAKYGFLEPADIVEGPYNSCFHHNELGCISINELKSQAKDNGLNKYDKIIVLGGRYYTNLLKSVFPHKPVYNPLEGCKGIGYMISKLNNAIKY